MNEEDYIDELETLASIIRYENTNEKLKVFINDYYQIVIQMPINHTETMFSIMNVMKELNVLHIKYFQGFNSNFEMSMEKSNPVIYCTYEKY